MKQLGKILLWIFGIFLLIQLIPVNTANPPTDSKQDFFTLNKSSEKIRQLIKTSCYDCHSYETVYPKAARIAPLSWSIRSNVEEARERANFSLWGKYNPDQRASILDHAAEMVDQRKMPIPGYLAYHPNAALSAAERKILSDYFLSLKPAKTK